LLLLLLLLLLFWRKFYNPEPESDVLMF